MVRRQEAGGIPFLVAAPRIQSHVVGAELHEPARTLRPAHAVYRQRGGASACRQTEASLHRSGGELRRIRLPYMPLGACKGENLLAPDETFHPYRRRHIPAPPVAIQRSRRRHYSTEQGNLFRLLQGYDKQFSLGRGFETVPEVLMRVALRRRAVVQSRVLRRQRPRLLRPFLR